MPALQVRDLPQDLYEELQQRATSERRSMAQQTVIAIEEHIYGVSRSSAVTPPKSRSLYSPYPESLEVIAERAVTRKRLNEEIDTLGDVVVPAGFFSPEELVRQSRDERGDELFARANQVL